MDYIKKASDQLRQLITEALGKTIADGIFPAVPVPDFNIEIPADKSHGDFASNIAMVCAKAFRTAPRKIADTICEKIDLNDTLFEKCEVAGAGFMNFFLSRKWFSDVVKKVLTENDDYGKTGLGNSNKILV